MCGRYTLTLEGGLVAESFDFAPGRLKLVPRYNIAPSQDVLVVTSQEERNHGQLMRWGLVPFWAKDPSIGYWMINAQEHAHEIRQVLEEERGAYKKSHLIPIRGGQAL